MHLRHLIPLSLFLVLGLWAMWVFAQFTEVPQSYLSEEAGFEEMLPISSEVAIGAHDKYTLSELQNWQRPQGPPFVGIQVGHLESEYVPEELAGLRANGSGAQGGGMTERAAMEIIAEIVREKLEAQGVRVQVLPATIPPGFVADAFISLHADGNNSGSVSGFKIAAPRRDFSEQSDELLNALYESYEAATALMRDANVTRRMRGYYAFNWYRYDHAIHPMTPAVILETGFMTSPKDRAIIIDAPERAAEGVVQGTLSFLRIQKLLP